MSLPSTVFFALFNVFSQYNKNSYHLHKAYYVPYSMLVFYLLQFFFLLRQSFTQPKMTLNCYVVKVFLKLLILLPVPLVDQNHRCSKLHLAFLLLMTY